MTWQAILTVAAASGAAALALQAVLMAAAAARPRVPAREPPVAAIADEAVAVTVAPSAMQLMPQADLRGMMAAATQTVSALRWIQAG
ncbi:hypothetical protein GCM10027040_27730 [Halomonas shantousis]